MINTYAIYMNLLFGVLGFTIFILNLCVLCGEYYFTIPLSEFFTNFTIFSISSLIGT